MRQSTWRAMEAFVKAGKAKAIGVSHYCKSHVQDILEIATIKPAVNQVQYHVGMGPLNAAGSGDKGRKFADAFDDFMADRFIVGDEAEAADEFLRYREELGINTFILRMSWIGLEQREMLKTAQKQVTTLFWIHP